ncbi:hypothetical protein 10KY502B_gene0037 [Xanthomonas phage 10KY502B]|nr:hypothetical protein 10KY502B_gene0037 [Xanthomonas phage 10KY502B]
MNLSFLATIAFAILVIVGAFLANLVVLVFTNSQWHVSGVVLSIMAAAASYWAQHNFTASAGYTQDVLVNPGLTGLHAAADRAEALGVGFQYLAIGLLVAAVVCFWLGLR